MPVGQSFHDLLVSVYPSLKLRGQQPTKSGKKENYKHSSLLLPRLQTLTTEG